MSIKFYIILNSILRLIVINYKMNIIINIVINIQTLYNLLYIIYSFLTGNFLDFKKIETFGVQIPMVDRICPLDTSRGSHVGNWIFAGCK